MNDIRACKSDIRFRNRFLVGFVLWTFSVAVAGAEPQSSASSTSSEQPAVRPTSPDIEKPPSPVSGEKPAGVSVPTGTETPSTPAKGDSSTTNSTAIPEFPPVGVPLSARDPMIRYLSRERVNELQERIRPSAQTIEARGGALRFGWSQRHSPSSILQLINPLAPTEYGSTSVSYHQVPPTVATGQPPLPRAFQDDVRHEANGLFFRAGW